MSEKYANKENLEYFWNNAKEYIGNERKEIEKQLHNWQKTEKAPAVQCKPVPNSELYPVVDFNFIETLPANGNKGPENPSIISGVSSMNVTRCGENIYNVFTTPYLNTIGNPDSDGFISKNGNRGSSTQWLIFCLPKSNVILNDAMYTLVVEIEEISGCAITLNISEGYNERSQLNTGAYKYLNATGTYYITCTNNNMYNPNVFLRTILEIPSGSGAYNVKFRCSVYEGVIDENSFRYVPYSGTDYSIQLDDTYYGGSLDVATGVMTVTWAGKVFDGTEDWYVDGTLDSSYIRYGTSSTYAIPNTELASQKGVCSHTVYLNAYTYPTEHIYVRPNGRILLFVSSSFLSDDASMKTWCAQQYANNTPFTLVYPILEPFTVQLTPTQIRSLPAIDKYEPRINTVYTDQEAVQVGYQRFYDENRLATIEARLDALEGD